MKISPILLLLCALVPRYAMAQEQSTESATERVIYSRATPKGLRAFIPRGGKSRFWGQSRLTYNGKQLWTHVYDVQKTRFSKNENNTYGTQESGLDLFVFSRPTQLQRISSTRFSYGRYGGYKRGGDYESVGVETLWLDPMGRKMPIIAVDFQDPNGIYGMITQHAICVFNQGLNQSAIVEKRFGYGNSNGAGWSSWMTHFAVMDNELTGIVYREGSSEDSRRTFYKWEKDRFKPFRRTQKDNFEVDGKEPEEVEVPFDTP